MPLLPLTYVVTKKSDDGHLCIDGINPSGKVTTAFCVWIKETALMPAPVAIPTAESTKSQPPVSKEKSIADGVAGAMMYMRDCDQNAFSSRSARRSLELMNVRYAAAIEAALESLEAVFRKWTQENHGDKSTSAVAGWCAMVKPDMIKLEHEVSGVLP
jgi:hypothetical protein